MDELSKEDLEVLVEFLGCQEIIDTRDIIEKYELDLDYRKTEKVMQKLFELLNEELSKRYVTSE